MVRTSEKRTLCSMGEKTMWLISGILFVIMLTVSASAQQPSQTPMEQAVIAKLQDEYGQNLQLRAALIQAQKEVADLKAKYETPPKKDEPKK